MTPAPQRLVEVSAAELRALSALCRAAKAQWGYDDTFLAARAADLTVSPMDLLDEIAVTRDADGFAGIVQLHLGRERRAVLDKLFVAPRAMRRGHGRALLSWALDRARQANARRVTLLSDPGALGFYLALGGRRAGTPASTGPVGAPPGRTGGSRSMPA